MFAAVALNIVASIPGLKPPMYTASITAGKNAMCGTISPISGQRINRITNVLQRRNKCHDITHHVGWAVDRPYFCLFLSHFSDAYRNYTQFDALNQTHQRLVANRVPEHVTGVTKATRTRTLAKLQFVGCG